MSKMKALERSIQPNRFKLNRVNNPKPEINTNLTVINKHSKVSSSESTSKTKSTSPSTR